MLLKHRHTGADLDLKYASETMRHIYNIWGYPVILKTKIGDEKISFEFIN